MTLGAENIVGTSGAEESVWLSGRRPFESAGSVGGELAVKWQMPWWHSHSPFTPFLVHLHTFAGPSFPVEIGLYDGDARTNCERKRHPLVHHLHVQIEQFHEAQHFKSSSPVPHPCPSDGLVSITEQHFNFFNSISCRLAHFAAITPLRRGCVCSSSPSSFFSL